MEQVKIDHHVFTGHGQQSRQQRKQHQPLNRFGLLNGQATVAPSTVLFHAGLSGPEPNEEDQRLDGTVSFKLAGDFHFVESPAV